MKKYLIKSLLLLIMLFMMVSCREPIEKSLTLNKYTVNFDSMGGSSVSSAEVIENLLATEPTAPTKTNYTFGGWYKEDTLTNKWDFTTDKVTGNITLYAKWLCTVTFDSDGGSTVSPITVESGNLIVKPSDPTKLYNPSEYYWFGGWYKEPTLINKWDFTTDEVTNNITLYAKWDVGV